ncbi:hypothetical protein AAGS40_20835 [Paraburkholderia sp. PREW-6R]|uniref:hypothetical protein n=1 Tax=Paraburkholderia sp. PREW-6R TaxID=3141544 RepID=UPI0031F5B22E
MKFSICLAAAALTLSAGAYAQNSQTFHFGEGQSGMSSGNTHAAPSAQAPAPQGSEDAGHTNATAKPAHKPKHRRHHRGHATQPDTYSHN